MLEAGCGRRNSLVARSRKRPVGGTLIRVVTIAREYGSGGGELAHIVAAKMSWDLLDSKLLEQVAYAAGIKRTRAARLDEHTYHWWSGQSRA
jgi:Cytidylate kinase-like family